MQDESDSSQRYRTHVRRVCVRADFGHEPAPVNTGRRPECGAIDHDERLRRQRQERYGRLHALESDCAAERRHHISHLADVFFRDEWRFHCVKRRDSAADLGHAPDFGDASHFRYTSDFCNASGHSGNGRHIRYGRGSSDGNDGRSDRRNGRREFVVIVQRLPFERRGSRAVRRQARRSDGQLCSELDGEHHSERQRLERHDDAGIPRREREAGRRILSTGLAAPTEGSELRAEGSGLRV